MAKASAAAAGKQPDGKQAQDGTGQQASGDVTPEVPATVPAADVPSPEGAAPVADDTDSGPDAADGATPDVEASATPPAPDETPAAAPLAPPVKRVKPAPVAAAVSEPNAAVRTAPGDHVAFVDHQGNPIKHDELFTDPGAQYTFMHTARRILQRFRFPGQHKESARFSTQLVYPEGARVPRHQAHALMQTVREAAEGKPDEGDPQGS